MSLLLFLQLSIVVENIKNQQKQAEKLKKKHAPQEWGARSMLHKGQKPCSPRVGSSKEQNPCSLESKNHTPQEWREVAGAEAMLPREQD